MPVIGRNSTRRWTPGRYRRCCVYLCASPDAPALPRYVLMIVTLDRVVQRAPVFRKCRYADRRVIIVLYKWGMRNGSSRQAYVCVCPEKIDVRRNLGMIGFSLMGPFSLKVGYTNPIYRFSVLYTRRIGCRGSFCIINGETSRFCWRLRLHVGEI